MLFYPRQQQQRLWLTTHFVYWKIWCNCLTSFHFSRNSEIISIRYIFKTLALLYFTGETCNCGVFTSLQVFKLPSKVSFISAFQEPYVLATWLLQFANTFHLSHAVKCVIKNTSVCLSNFKYSRIYWNYSIYFHLTGGRELWNMLLFVR